MRPRWLRPKNNQKLLDFMKALHEKQVQCIELKNALGEERQLREVQRKAYNKAHEELEQANRFNEVLMSENDKLKEQLAQQEKPYANLSPFQPFIPKVRETKTPQFTDNDRRKYAIQAAVAYIEKHITPAITFEVDAKARKVVAIMQSDKRGVGKIRSHLLCRDDQVFNEHIFKAATLANLLQDHIAAEKFANAAQPNKVVVGQNVSFENSIYTIIPNHHSLGKNDDRVMLDSYIAAKGKILNDTNAQY